METALLVALVGVGLMLAHLAVASAIVRPRPGARALPASVVRPVFGLDEGAEAALRSYLDQGAAQCVLSFQDPADAALPLARRLAAEYGPERLQVLVNPVLPGFSGKASNLLHGVAAARHTRLVLSDADIVAPPGALAALLGPLADGSAGLVAGVPVHHGGRGLWGLLYQLHLNGTVLLQWLPYAALGLPVGAPGAALAVRSEALEAAGGVAAAGDHLADDLALALRLRRAGCRLRVGPVVHSLAGACDWPRYRSLIQRAAAIFGYGLPLHLTLAHLLVNYAYLPALLVPGLRLAAGCYLAGRALVLALAELRFSPRPQPAAGLLVPLLDLTTLWLFAVTLATRRITWRGVRYRIDSRGRLAAPAPPAWEGGGSPPGR